MKILFVCAGNTCRSVLARYYAAGLAPRFFHDGQAGRTPEFSSAGLAVEEDIIQPQIVPELLRKEGVGEFKHTPAQLTAEMAREAGLILTMTAAQKATVARLFPEAAPRTSTLAEYAGFGAADIADPYGRDDLFYFEVFKLIKAAVTAALERLEKEV